MSLFGIIAFLKSLFAGKQKDQTFVCLLISITVANFPDFFFCCYMYTDYTTAFNFQDTAHLRARFSLIYNDSLLLIPI